MNNKIKYIFVGILIIFSIFLVSGAIRNPNDYYALIGQFSDIAVLQNDEINVTYPVYFIPLTSSETYTLTVTSVTANINLSQLNQINPKIVNATKNEGIKRGYDVKKIILPTYNVVNP